MVRRSNSSGFSSPSSWGKLGDCDCASENNEVDRLWRESVAILIRFVKIACKGDTTMSWKMSNAA